ncbi:4Fe-4S dicluster domain-containing protein [Corynebacterium poyangense]|uniref:4Fe-4S dicluster domain-containing protein n=1 Tax=Corynebacterium poyangense TaxID=2684405 RepID=A0A7H0SS76_9CORY|nr:4Fe-4S dicluster domain-containing protein [Corynebacterium poyangense]
MLRLKESEHDPGYDPRQRKAFFTDTSVCIGCKACEVACKEWNRNPEDGYQLTGMSYDNTGTLSANTWRHVAFVEQTQERITEARESGRQLIDLGVPQMPGQTRSAQHPVGGDTTPPDTPDFRWLMASDVCKHCTNAGCLDVCPTGALFRTEFGTVVVQTDVCNGCGTCVAGCPFGVIERRSDGVVKLREDHGFREGQDWDAPLEDTRQPFDIRRLLPRRQPKGEDYTPGQKAPIPDIGVARKCTMCYDRLKAGEQPACSKTCPTESIQFGTREEMLAKARARVAELHAQGMTEARLYGANDADGVGGTGSIFLLLDEPEVYGLPPDPQVPTEDLPGMAKKATLAAAGMIGAVAVSFLLGGTK